MLFVYFTVAEIVIGDTFDATILTSYGMTECMPISSPPQTYRLDPVGTSGIPVGPDVKIVDDDLRVMPPMHPGNIMVRGPPCFGGYEDNTNATEESFFKVEGEAGWFSTGDMGYMDKNSFLFISGRSKEIINRGGETISPFEIEEAVVQHPLVKEVLAFSAPHATFQETIGVVIVSLPNQPRVDLPTLWRYLDSKLHRSKWPQVIVYMNALPKNAANKVLRIRLGERMKLANVDEESPPSSRLLEATCPPVGTPLTQPIAVQSIVVDVKKVEELLLKQPSVSEAVVVVVDLPFKPGSMVGFVVAPKDSADELIKLCDFSLHKYEVPLFIYAMDAMPKSNMGYPDIPLLTEKAKDLYAQRSVVAPRNPMEVKVEKIWRHFLGCESVVSVKDSFFDLGGDSLKAGQLVNAMRKKFRIQLSVGDLFTSPTIENMANMLSKMKILGSPNLSYKSLPVAESAGEMDLISESPSLVQSPTTDVDPETKFGGSWEHSTNLSSTALPVLMVQLIPISKFFSMSWNNLSP